MDGHVHMQMDIRMTKIYVHGYAYGCGYTDAFVHICVRGFFHNINSNAYGVHASWIILCGMDMHVHMHI